MKSLYLIIAGLFALSLAACGKAEDTPIASGDATDIPMKMANEDNIAHGDHSMGDGLGHATGTIRSVGSQGDFLTIEHGPFEGDISMGAMTMGFATLSNIDVSGLAAGDAVAFMVKQGRDGSYRIMAICNTVTQGADCLDKLSVH